ncbi:sigma-70 family RNA polymerase sigma factor [Streptomyces sp. 21So2-11]|uniref:sigma-70 family RNA polymerase sigma factor n=1 Tax=Streptomyces sp. 21So2-11 TaxID=3144408 RepID=UPI00321B41CF
MRASGAGDPHAFAILYTALFPAVCAAIVRVLRDAAQAEEVAQEVIVEVWSTSSRFRAGRGTVDAWVMSIARHRALDRVRTVTQAARRDVTRVRLDTVPAFDSVAEQVLDRLEADEVLRGLAHLSALQCQALTLVYLHGATHAQGAQHLGVPLGTFKTRVRDALRQLRRDLNRGPGADPAQVAGPRHVRGAPSTTAPAPPQ